MSNTVTIEKKVNVDFGEVGSHEISTEVDVQIDYVRCNQCGDDLDMQLISDSYGDIQVTVEPCDCNGGEDL